MEVVQPTVLEQNPPNNKPDGVLCLPPLPSLLQPAVTNDNEIQPHYFFCLSSNADSCSNSNFKAPKHFVGNVHKIGVVFNNHTHPRQGGSSLNNLVTTWQCSRTCKHYKWPSTVHNRPTSAYIETNVHCSSVSYTKEVSRLAVLLFV